MPAPSNIIPGIHYWWRVSVRVSDVSGVGCVGCRVPGGSWHCPGTVIDTVLGTVLAPSLPYRGL